MINPIRQQVLFKPFPPDEKSAGGLIVPDSYKEVSNKGTIISVGKGSTTHPMNFKKGDICFRIKDSGSEVIENGETFFLLDQGWLIAKLKTD